MKSTSIVKKGEVYEFIEEQLKKGYIRLLKSSQIVPVFLQERRIVRRKQCKTTDIQINRQLRIIIPYS